jgi:hypothetical protein
LDGDWLIAAPTFAPSGGPETAHAQPPANVRAGNLDILVIMADDIGLVDLRAQSGASCGRASRL